MRLREVRVCTFPSIFAGFGLHGLNIRSFGTRPPKSGRKVGILCAKNCQKVCKIGKIADAPGKEAVRLMGYHYRIVGQHLDVLFHMLTFDDRVVVKRKLDLFSVFRAHDVYLLLLCVLGDASSFG
jgi:hypothetical protein